MFNVDIGYPSISAHTYNDGKGNICQHRLSVSAYMFSVDKGDLCQYRL